MAHDRAYCRTECTLPGYFQDDVDQFVYAFLETRSRTLCHEPLLLLRALISVSIDAFAYKFTYMHTYMRMFLYKFIIKL